MKTRRIAWSTGRMFSKSGQMNKVLSKFRRVRERCPQPNTVAVYAFRKSVILASMLLTSDHNGSL